MSALDINSMMSWGNGNYSPASNMNTLLLGDTSAPVVNASTGTAPSFVQRMTGWISPDNTQNAGWGGLALGGAQALMSGYMGFRQLQLARDQLNESRRQFHLDFENQRKLTNTRLEDRQRARVSSGNSGYESVSSYMARNGV